MLLRVVAQSLKPVKLFSQELPTYLLHNSSNIVGATHAHYAWFTKTYGLYPSHDALQVPHHYQHARNNSQHCWRNNVRSCCVRLHAALPTTKGLFPFHRFKVHYTCFSPFQWILKNYLYENKNVRSINQVFLGRKAPSELLLKLEA